MVDSLFGRLQYILPSFEGRMEYNPFTQGTVLFFKFKNRRLFQIFISDLEFTENIVHTIVEKLNCEVLNRRREQVARQNELGKGYW